MQIHHHQGRRCQQFMPRRAAWHRASAQPGWRASFCSLFITIIGRSVNSWTSGALALGAFHTSRVSPWACEGGFIIFTLKMAKPEPRKAANWNCSYFISALSYSKFVCFSFFLLAPSLLCWASYINTPPPYSSATFLYWPWTCWLQDPSASSANVPVNATSGRQASRFFTTHGVSART